MTETTAGIGHNRPPSQIEILADRYAPSAAKVEALAGRANQAPKEIKSDSDLEVVSSIVRDARDLFKVVETERVAEKEPHLSAGREVDAFFKTMTERLNRIGEVFQKIANDHVRIKAAEARRKAEEEARAARAEAERQAELARRAEETNRPKTAENFGARADAAEARAEAAEAIASAGVADLTRQRLDSGVLTTAKSEWAFEVTDFEQIPLDRLRPYLKRDAVDAALRQYVRMNKGAAPLAGVRIFEDIKSIIR